MEDLDRQAKDSNISKLSQEFDLNFNIKNVQYANTESYYWHLLDVSGLDQGYRKTRDLAGTLTYGWLDGKMTVSKVHSGLHNLWCVPSKKVRFQLMSGIQRINNQRTST